MKSDFLDAAFAEQMLDAKKIRGATQRKVKEKRAAKNKPMLVRGEVEARLAQEERARRESPEHEVSNAELTRYRLHRREHVGEKFVDVGHDAAQAGKIVKKRKRTECDERLFRALGDERADAMVLVRAAFMMITEGMGMQTFNPFKVSGGGGDVNRGHRLMAVYWLWAEEVRRRRLSHADCLEVAAFGRSPQEVDRNSKQRNGTALANLIACLDVAIECGILLIRGKG